MILHTVIACEDIFFDFNTVEDSKVKANGPLSTNPTDYLNEYKLNSEHNFKYITGLDKI